MFRPLHWAIIRSQIVPQRDYNHNHAHFIYRVHTPDIAYGLDFI